MGLNSPEWALISISPELVAHYENQNGKLSSKYHPKSFENQQFYGSKKLITTFELESFYNLEKNDFHSFKDPMELVKIGIIDIWLGNKDRKPDNPNILICDINQRFHFVPIDHTAAFGYCENYQKVSDAMLFMEERYYILKIPLIKKIAKFVGSKGITAFKNDVENCMQITLDNLDVIFEQVPSEWGFSKKSKAHLKKILSDNDRNKRVLLQYLSYL